MRKMCYRFFAGLLNVQERWLNKMAGKGYRLVRTGKLLYEFEECEPGQVQYCVEFIGQKSNSSAKEYHDFLEDMGYRVFYKNINLNESVGKIRWRPWAEKGGKIAADVTTFNRELLIVEKKSDGRPFELHTSYEDRQRYYKTLRNPYLCLSAVFAALGIILRTWIWGILSLPFLVPLILYQITLMRLEEQGKLRE